jgi:hypothetical protein
LIFAAAQIFLWSDDIFSFFPINGYENLILNDILQQSNILTEIPNSIAPLGTMSDEELVTVGNVNRRDL